MSIKILILITVVLCFPTAECVAEPWPAGGGQEIGRVGYSGGLPDGYEPSGAVWHPGRQKLLIVDDSGLISQLDPNGENIITWNVDEDLEGITLIDPESSLIYLGVESPDSILEFDLETGSLTSNQWDLTAWMDGPNNHGLEALTWGDGFFYAGLQEDGRIFKFNLLENSQVQYLGTIISHDGLDDISGMQYDSCTGILYAVYDNHNLLVEMTAAGSFLRQYELPEDDQEGVALIGGSGSGETPVFIAVDSGEVWRYDSFPVAACHPASGIHTVPHQNPPRLGCNPNPFNPSTEIYFDLDRPRWIDLSILDLQGRLVRKLLSGSRAEGDHRVSWNGCTDSGLHVASGVYFARLQLSDNAATAKLLLLK